MISKNYIGRIAYSMFAAGLLTSPHLGIAQEANQLDTPAQSLEACVNPLQTEIIAGTPFDVYQTSDSGRELYFLGDIHTEGNKDLYLDITSRMSDQRVIQGVVFEEFLLGFYTPDALPENYSILRDSFRGHELTIIGSLDLETHEATVDLMAATLSLQAATAYMLLFNQLQDEGLDNLNLSEEGVLAARDFLAAASEVRTLYDNVLDYRERNPNVEISQDSLNALMIQEREDYLFDIIEQAYERGLPKLAISWGRGHTQTFIDRYCGQDVSIFVANSPYLDTETEDDFAAGTMTIPDRVREVIEKANQIITVSDAFLPHLFPELRREQE